MPKGSDLTFTSKVYDLWDNKSKQFKPSRKRSEGFILTHYAADVEYSTEDWLSKNKDPLNDNITALLASSTDPHIASLFEGLGVDNPRAKQRVKKGIFRTVAQRHKEQLNSLMTQLNSTQPHFVRCIIPNELKHPRVFNGPLVLDQLRCNGVLEGIRIARTGFPNRLTFTEFRQRYELLTPGLPRGFIESRNAAQMILSSLDLDRSMYQMGRTKVFFRAGLVYPFGGVANDSLRNSRNDEIDLCRKLSHLFKHPYGVICSAVLQGRDCIVKKQLVSFNRIFWLSASFNLTLGGGCTPE